MKIKASLKVPELQLARYKQELRDQATEVLIFAAFEWFNVATAEIPVWSGASLAAFIPLARLLSQPLSVTGRSDLPAGFRSARIAKGMNLSDAQFTSDENLGLFLFKFETNLRHLVFNEFNNANAGGDPAVFSRLLRPGPYNFTQKAADAFMRRVRDARLPDAGKFIKVKRRIRVR